MGGHEHEETLAASHDALVRLRSRQEGLLQAAELEKTELEDELHRMKRQFSNVENDKQKLQGDLHESSALLQKLQGQMNTFKHQFEQTSTQLVQVRAALVAKEQ